MPLIHFVSGDVGKNRKIEHFERWGRKIQYKSFFRNDRKSFFSPLVEEFMELISAWPIDPSTLHLSTLNIYV